MGRPAGTTGRGRGALAVAVLTIASLGLPWPAVVGAADPHGQPARSAQPEVLRVRTEAAAASVTLTGFADNTIATGLVNPTAIQFASDGRVFVAEKSGIIRVFPSLAMTSSTVFADLRTSVHNFWDRGLLGMALDPAFPTRPYVYVLYTYDHVLGSTAAAPRWGIADEDSDTCPSPPGSTTDGCIVSARLSRLTASGSAATAESVLIEDWCQQFPSHSVGSIAFGSDGALYASGGDGASFLNADWGQFGDSFAGDPANPCGDPPTAAGPELAPPDAEGGALRAQDVRTIPPPAGTTYPATVLADGPTAWWRLGETSGTAFADSAPGATHPGTRQGTVTQGQAGAIAGDANGAIRVAGAGYIQIADAADLHFADGPLTWELWVKRGTDQDREQILISQAGIGTPTIGFTGDNQFGVAKGGIAYMAFEQGTTTDQLWHHFVVTHDATTTRIFKDGIDVTGPVAGQVFAQPTGGTQIGREAQFADSPAAGTIDEVAVYRTVLSPATIANHNAVGRTGAGGPVTDPTGMNGSIIRVDPDTGAGLPTNPLASSTDAAARRIVATGLRNPFRIAVRPGTSEVWVGDVGWNDWEEVDRIVSPTTALTNFGWPCYEGNVRQVSYEAAGLAICQSLYATPSATTGPVYTYKHTANVVTGETCPTGSSAIAGMAFYPEVGGSYPASYRGALFFADHSRGCIWVMPKGTNGDPDPAQRQVFVAAAAGPVDLRIGPGGDLYYVDFDGGTIHRVVFTTGNQAPVASFTASPSSGPAPLTVAFNGAASSDPEGAALTYDWDLDGDGAYDDATGVAAGRTYSTPGLVSVGLRVTDPGGAAGTTTRTVDVGNSPPVPTIDGPAASLTWKVGDSIPFSGHASDPQDGTEPASRLSWSLVMHHCPSNCHTHTIQTLAGVASGTFIAPDHEYPSFLEIVLTATDANGAVASTSVNLDPQTVNLSFQTVPAGLTIGVNTATGTTPMTRTVIVGSTNSISAAATQTLGGLTYGFVSWSDGGAASHTVIAGATPVAYTATYIVRSSDVRVTQTATQSGSTRTWTYRGTISTTGPASALDVRLTDAATKGFVFNSATTTKGTCTTSSTSVACAFGTVAVGEVVTVTIIGTSGPGHGAFSNTMNVTTASPDPVTTNNVATVALKNR